MFRRLQRATGHCEGRDSATRLQHFVMLFLWCNMDQSPIQQCLFRYDDEMMFKRTFAIQFMASLDAVNYQDNCYRGWKGHKPAVEDAKHLAEKAWEEWKETIGLVG